MKTITKIISGAQTGADRGGLNAAIALGLPYGGFIPKGRKSEDGTIPAFYQGLVETESTNYLVRTRMNVQASAMTLIFTYGALTGGSLKTADFAKRYGKPWLPIDLTSQQPEAVKAWIEANGPVEGILNIAGTRGSHAPTLEADVEQFLINVLGAYRPKSLR